LLFSLKQSTRRLVITFQRIQVNFFFCKEHDDDKDPLNDKDVEESNKNKKEVIGRAGAAARY
jgi:hypothetical protein